MTPLRREHPFDFNFRTTNEYRQRRPLFNFMDHAAGEDRLIDYARGEVAEAVEELEVPGTPDYKKVIDEVNDAFNMTVPMIVLAYGYDFQPSHHLYGVNGDGKHSNAFELLDVYLAEAKENQRALIQSIRMMWSIGNHALNLDEKTRITSIISTYTKVSNNYPEFLYSGNDPITGEAIADDDKPDAFTHFTSGLKMVRKELNKTLEPRKDILQFLPFIADWKHSEAALQALQTELESSRKVSNGLAQLGQEAAIPSPKATFQITQKSGILFSNS